MILDNMIISVLQRDLLGKLEELFGNEHESSPPLSLDHYF